MAKSLKKFFNILGGLNVRSPELLKGESYATDIRNIEFSENFSLTKRKGNQSLISGFGKCGSFTFNEIDLATGITSAKRLLIDDTIRTVRENEITISYAGSLTPAYQVKLNTTDSKFYLYLYEDGTEIQSIDLGTGKEGSPIDIATMIAAISAPFSGSASGVDTLPAAFIKTTDRITTPEKLKYYDVVAASVPSGADTTPFGDLLSNVNDADFEPMSMIQAHDVVYLTSKDTGLWKYDGTLLIRAGLPSPSTITSPDSDPTATSKWVYIATYEYTDDKDNLIISQRSNELIVPSGTSTSVTVPSVNLADGYDANNITVNLYRTVANGTDFYLIGTATNVSATPTVFASGTASQADSAITGNAVYTVPFRDAEPPPTCRYIDVWRNQLVLTGNLSSVPTVYLANTEDLEGFDDRNSFETSSRLGGANTGVKALDNFLYIFRKNSISVATGYPEDLTLVVDTMSDEGIGALSHASIIEADKSIYFMSKRGIYSIQGNRLNYMSDILQPVFNNITYREKRCQTFFSIYENKIYFLLPYYVNNGVDKSQNNIIVFDAQSKSWTLWDNFDFTSGLNLDDTTLWFVSNEDGDFYYNERLNTESLLDYADHEEPVSVFYKTHWESLDEPSIPKKFTKLKVFALDTDYQNFGATDFTLTVETNNDFRLDTAISFDLDFGSDGDGWGEEAWGDFPWGNETQLTKTSRLQARRLLAIRFVFKNSTLHENILISGFEIEYAPQYLPKLRGTK